MRSLLLPFALLLGMCNGAPAVDLGNQAPVKPVATYPENIPNPERQGGDTVANATVIGGLPYSDSGTTAGYNNNYDAVCPYNGSVAPDVVYKYVATTTVVSDIDLCGSAYDTKLYVYDAGLNLIACNDDYYDGAPCGVYVSLISSFLFTAGTTYYIVVDGYGSASGAYNLTIDPFPSSCYLPHPNTEGEPPLGPNYIDNYNGGCFAPPDYPFQGLVGDANGETFLSGVGGWYVVNGSNYRDTDWFILTMGPQGTIEITACAEYPTYIFELGPQECGAVNVIQQATADSRDDTQMTIAGYDRLAPVWFWVGATVFAAPGGGTEEYGYLVWFSGLEPDPIATESKTWSTVKALYE